jgi:hypothetical protein
VLRLFVLCKHRTATQKTYADGSCKFIKFCEWLGVDPFAVVAETTLAKCALLFCHDCSVNSLDSWMSAVSSFSRAWATLSCRGTSCTTQPALDCSTTAKWIG